MPTPRRSRTSPADRAYSAATQRAAYARKVEFLRRWKTLRGCKDRPARGWRVLTVDHMDGKSLPIERIRSIRRLKQEIRQHRCEVRCFNCHAIRTYEEQLGREARARKAA